MTKVLLLAAVAAMVVAPVAALASDATPTGGFNSGSGNPQNNFTIVNNVVGGNGLELALSAQQRYSAPTVTDNNNGTYFAQAGSSGGHALWNFDFSIEALGTTALGDYTYNIAVTSSNNDFSANIDPLALPDNAPTGSTTVKQNSENLTFGDLNGGHTSGLFTNHTGTFDFNEAENYTFVLTAKTLDGTSTVLSDTIHVNVAATPLPSAASMGLGMLGLIGAAGLLRKKLRTA